MSCKDLKYSKVKNLNDMDFTLESCKKNELETFSVQILDDLLKSKQGVLYVFTSSIKEYFQQIRLEKEISILYKQQTSVSHKLSELQERLQMAREEKENRDSSRNMRRVLMYEQNLAIRAEPTSNLPISNDKVAVSFDFHHINECSPEETCSFVLIITDGKRYKASNCRPSIAGMEELISTLNKTNDLHQFIVNVRKKFRESFEQSI